MKLHKFKVLRRMDGDREYGPDIEGGDERELSAVDAAVLVRSGALEPKGKDAVAAMEEVLGPRARWGVQAAPAGSVTNEAMDANNERAAAEGAQPRPAKADQSARTKDAGNADKNKADVTTPTPGTVTAGEPGVQQVTGDNAGAAPAGDAGDAGDAGAAAATATTTATAPATAKPARAKRSSGKKR